MNKKYVRGRAFEQKVVKWFREAGWPYVVRSAGSKGVADVVAIGRKSKWECGCSSIFMHCEHGHHPSVLPVKTVLVQCKTGEKKISAEEIDELESVAKAVGAMAIVATPAPKHWQEKIKFQEVENGHLRVISP